MSADVAQPCAGLDPLGEEYYQCMADAARSRVSKKRFKHMEGVADTAVQLARAYGLDEREARLAGILHDWDKGLDNDEIRAKARELGLVEHIGPWVIEHMPQVMHGPTAAAELAAMHPEMPASIISAIDKHTIAAPQMSDLDKAIYIADALEPTRTFEEAPRLRAMIGQVSLDELYFKVYQFWTEALVRSEGLLHPDTFAIWNEMVMPKAQARLARYEERCRRKKQR